MKLIILCLFLTGCAYNAPTQSQKVYSKQASSDSQKQAAIVLVNKGFSLTSNANGIISTAPKVVKLNSKQADCGNIWGFPYIDDKRTIIKLSYSVTFLNSKMTVTTNINGTFNAIAEGGSKTLVCSSNGTLEQELLNLI